MITILGLLVGGLVLNGGSSVSQSTIETLISKVKELNEEELKINNKVCGCYTITGTKGHNVYFIKENEDPKYNITYHIIYLSASNCNRKNSSKIKKGSISMAKDFEMFFKNKNPNLEIKNGSFDFVKRNIEEFCKKLCMLNE